MQVSVENTSAIGRKLNVVLPADTVESAVQSKLKGLVKKVRIQGFRQGKVPLRIVDQHYRADVTNEVLGDLIQSSLLEALEQQDLTPAVQPDVLPMPMQKGQDFVYEASFDVYPEFQKLDLDGIKVTQKECEITSADVDKVVENMRKQQITWNEVARKAKKGDRLIMDFVGTVDGEEFDGGKADDFGLVLGEGQMLADFEKGATGMKAGQQKDVEVTFPDDYSEDLGGKKALFSITVKTVSESQLPEIDEDFIRSFGIDSAKQEDLLKEVRNNLEDSLERQLSTSLRQSVFDALLEQNDDVQVPLKMVQEEAQQMNQEQKNRFIQQGIDPKMLENLPEPDFEVMRPEAQKRVALSLLMMEVIREHKIEADEQRVKQRIEKMASSYETPAEFIDYYQQNEQALAQVKAIVLEEQVVDFLLEKADTSIEQVSATDFLNLQ